jgi:hypothetical protein
LRFFPFLHLGNTFLNTFRLGLELPQIFFQSGNDFLARNEMPAKPHTSVMLMTPATAATMAPFPGHTLFVMTMLFVPAAPAIFIATFLPFFVLFSMMMTVSTTTAAFFSVHRIPPS